MGCSPRLGKRFSAAGRQEIPRPTLWGRFPTSERDSSGTPADRRSSFRTRRQTRSCRRSRGVAAVPESSEIWLRGAGGWVGGGGEESPVPAGPRSCRTASPPASRGGPGAFGGAGGTPAGHRPRRQRGSSRRRRKGGGIEVTFCFYFLRFSGSWQVRGCVCRRQLLTSSNFYRDAQREFCADRLRVSFLNEQQSSLRP